jgi:hypothetical protein
MAKVTDKAKLVYMQMWHRDHPGYAAAAMRKYRMEHPEHSEYKKTWHAEHPGARKKYYTTKLEKLAGRKKPKRCDVCRKSGRQIDFDHCHKSGIFRGWVCRQCNIILGHAGDSSKLLRKLADYLDAAKKL